MKRSGNGNRNYLFSQNLSGNRKQQAAVDTTGEGNQERIEAGQIFFKHRRFFLYIFFHMTFDFGL
jgi:hypothetical protein